MKARNKLLKKEYILTEQFYKALEMVGKLHANQPRKFTDIPYISHLMAVSSLVLEASEHTIFKSKREDLAIAALLHDTLEDQGGKFPLVEIKKQFGSFVAQIVDDCSDDVISEKGQEKAPWRLRKEKYLAHIGETRYETQLVSCADKLHNVRSILWDHRRIGDRIFDRFNASKEDTLWYYQELAKAFKKSWPENPLAAEFDQTVRLAIKESSI
jgi:(p)ppGpp synthase/HD superfamily hydrolase